MTYAELAAELERKRLELIARLRLQFIRDARERAKEGS